MNMTTVQLQIKSIEAQLEVLRAQLASLSPSEPSQNNASSLCGLLSGISESTDEDIQNALYTMDGDSLMSS